MMRATSSHALAALLAWLSLQAHASAQAVATPPPQAKPDATPSSAQGERAPAAQGRPEGESAFESISSGFEPKPGGITVNEIVSHALESSPRLEIATIQSDKADQNQRRARLGFAPRIDLGAQYRRMNEVDLPPEVAPIIKQVLNQYSVTASAQLPLTEWFLTVLPTYRGAKRMNEVSDMQREAVALQVAYDARVAFYELVLVRGALLLSEDSIARLEVTVRDLRALVGAGVATQTDLLLAEAALADAHTQHTLHQGQVEVALLRLEQVVGVELDEKRGLGEALVGFELEPTPDLKEALEDAYNDRPELNGLRLLTGAREDFAKARRGARWPQLKAFGNMLTAQPNPRVFPAQEEFDTTWEVGLAVSWSPNDSVYAHTQAQDADIDVALVREDLILAEQGVAIEVTQAITTHRTAREAVVARTQGVEAARRRFRDQSQLMQAGAATPKDVLESETELRQAELGWISAYIRVREAEAALLKARGETGIASSGSAP